MGIQVEVLDRRTRQRRLMFWLLVGVCACIWCARFVYGLLGLLDLRPHVIYRLPSPDGQLTAVLFTDDCGVPCDMTNAVTLVGDRDTPLSVSPDFYSVEDSAEPVWALLNDYPVWIKVTWQGNRHLQILVDKHRKYKLSDRMASGQVTVNGKTVTVDIRSVDKP